MCHIADSVEVLNGLDGVEIENIKVCLAVLSHCNVGKIYWNGVIREIQGIPIKG